MNTIFTKPASGDGQTALQVAALCWRLNNNQIEVLLITSRDTGRWVIPKGWPIPGLSAAAAAAREAWEEAGVQGRVHDMALGEYPYDKLGPLAAAKRCNVQVFGLQVAVMKDRFPESKQRRRAWFAPADAAQLVAEAELSQLLDRIGQQPDLLNDHDSASGA